MARVGAVHQCVLSVLVVTLLVGSQSALSHDPDRADPSDIGPSLPSAPAPSERTPGTASFGLPGEAVPRPVPAWRSLDLGRDTERQNGHESEIFVVCPLGSRASPYQPGAPDPGSGDFTVPGCPLRVVDVPNPLGSPWIDANPVDPSQFAFFSLHGEPVVDGPTERSRTRDTMTTFTTTEHGIEWSDQPLTSAQVPPGSTGEFASGAFDRSGNVYVAYAWHHANGSVKPSHSEIRLYKAEPVDVDRTVKDAYPWAHRIHIGEGLTDEVHVVRVDPHPFTNETTVPTNDTGGEGNESRDGNERWFDRFSGENGERTDRVVAVWPVNASAKSRGNGSDVGWIDAAWSDRLSTDEWVRLDEEERIGPCLETGRPVQFRGAVYIPCVVGPGYDARSRSNVGDIDIWRLDPFSGETEHVGFTGISAGKPMLSIGDRGYMAMVSSGFDPEAGDGTVHVSWGWHGKVWNPVAADLYPYFHRIAGGGTTEDARVTAAVLFTTDPTLVLIYHERQQMEPPEGDIQRYDAASPPRPREYTKTIITMNECNGVLAAAAVPLGDGMMSFHWEAYQRNPGTFNDAQDGLVRFRLPDPDGEYIALAVNDYGSLQYGWLRADDAGEVCTIIPPPLVSVAAGLPQALQVGTGAGHLVGASIGILASAMIAYLLTIKRRSAQSVSAEDR